MRAMHKFALGLIAAASLAAGLGFAADRPQTTPLAEAQLFISPCGEPYRSKAGDPYPVVAWFQKIDTNKDGHVDRAEFRADAEAFFKVLDRDHDGIIDDSEVSYYEHQIVPEVMQGQQSSKLDGARVILAALAQDEGSSSNKVREDDLPFQGAGAYGLLNDSEPVRAADRDFNGRIRLSDFLARADHNFDALDEGGRGYLTLEDLPRTEAQLRARSARRKA
jgi:hypothetical protein